jgi:tRNA U34 5-methylaminomethyl-2-thiouridine-forming methyltransferase MnmC
LYLPELDETYHSTHGALQESQHVYIKSGLEHWLDLNGSENSVRIFEMGFGTGLNAFLTSAFSRQHSVKVEYTTIEKFPLSNQAHADLNYFKLLTTENYESDSEMIVNAQWEKATSVHPYFKLKKIEGDFFELSEAKPCFDLIYYDAFGHRAQSELWEEEAFRICASILCQGGILVTYASKGSARRNLMAAGFEVEKIPGAPGKREMMRATKI